MATNSTRPYKSQHQQKTKNFNIEKSQNKPEDKQYSQYLKQLNILRSIFSETWNDEDLFAVLNEVDGDVDIAISRISEGHAQQWSSAGSKKSKKENKKQEIHSVPTTKDETPVNIRGRGFLNNLDYIESNRGRGRGRGGKVSLGTRRPPLTKQNENEKPQFEKAKGWDTDDSKKESSSWSNDNSWEQTPKEKESRGNVVEQEQIKEKGPVTANRTSNVKSTQNYQKNWNQNIQEPFTNKLKSDTKKSTWAQIAKPEPPKTTAPSNAQSGAPLLSKSLKKQTEEKKEEVKESVKSLAQVSKELLPPGFEKSRESIQKKPTETPVVLPTSVTSVGNVGVKFGSLSLVEDEDKKQPPFSSISQPTQTSPQVQTQNASQPAYMMHGNDQNSQTPSVTPFHQYHNQQQSYSSPAPDYSSLYSNPGSVSDSQTSQQPQMNPFMNPASLANMYAAYFPYYMNQFPGANPYASPNPAPPPSNFAQQPFMNKYPMYPNTSAGAQKPSQPQQQSPSQVQPQQNAAQPQQVTNHLYGGYYAGEDYDYSKYLMNAAASKPSGDKEQKSMLQNSAAFYSQFMHPQAHYPNFMPGNFMHQPMQNAPQNTQSQSSSGNQNSSGRPQQQQPPFWGSQ